MNVWQRIDKFVAQFDSAIRLSQTRVCLCIFLKLLISIFLKLLQIPPWIAHLKGLKPIEYDFVQIDMICLVIIQSYFPSFSNLPFNSCVLKQGLKRSNNTLIKSASAQNHLCRFQARHTPPDLALASSLIVLPVPISPYPDFFLASSLTLFLFFVAIFSNPFLSNHPKGLKPIEQGFELFVDKFKLLPLFFDILFDPLNTPKFKSSPTLPWSNHPQTVETHRAKVKVLLLGNFKLAFNVATPTFYWHPP